MYCVAEMWRRVSRGGTRRCLGVEMMGVVQYMLARLWCLPTRPDCSNDGQVNVYSAVENILVLVLVEQYQSSNRYGRFCAAPVR